MKILALCTLPLLQTPSTSPLIAQLKPCSPTESASLRWSPKGAAVELQKVDGVLVGSFLLGPRGSAPVRVELNQSEGASYVDGLRIDCDRDGVFSPSETLHCLPSENRHKWWSSFDAEVRISVPTVEGAPPVTRPYPISLWFVQDPAEPDAAPALRWSRRGWHEGECVIGAKPAFVMITEMLMDGVFDQRDAWLLAREHKDLYGSASRNLDGHAWLDGVAYRPVSIDVHGRSISFEAFDPGYTEAEEIAKRDVLAADRAHPRAEKPLEFSHDLAATLAKAKQDGKRVLIDFETTWCGPCATMNQLVYTAKPVVEAASKTLAVKVDGDEHADLVKRYGVEAYPTILLLDTEGKELRRAVGYRSVAEMVEMLRKEP